MLPPNPVLTQNLHFYFVGQPARAMPLPFFDEVPAGFPSPAGDYLQNTLDLNEHLVKHPAATFFVVVKGTSMIDAGLQDGDILLVDKALTPKSKDIVVARLEGSFTVKRLIKTQSGAYLKAENPSFPPIQITEEMCFEVFGVVTHVIHKTR